MTVRTSHENRNQRTLPQFLRPAPSANWRSRCSTPATGTRAANWATVPGCCRGRRHFLPTGPEIGPEMRRTRTVEQFYRDPATPPFCLPNLRIRARAKAPRTSARCASGAGQIHRQKASIGWAARAHKWGRRPERPRTFWRDLRANFSDECSGSACTWPMSRVPGGVT